MSVWSANRLAENALDRPAIETSTAARVVLRIQLLAFGKNRIALVWTPNNFNCSEEPEEIVNFVGPTARRSAASRARNVSINEYQQRGPSAATG